MALKTYVLLPNMDVNAPVFVRISKDERVRVDKLPKWSPFLIVTFQDKEGKNRTIRYKQTAESIYQDEQIKNQNIPANLPFTTNERRAPEFRHGVLVTKEILLQKYLDAYPANESFEGICPDVPVKVYKEYKKTDELKTSNEDFKLRTKAASKIVELDLKAAQEMLLRLNGSFFEVPAEGEDKTAEEALIECQDMLVAFMDAAEMEGLKAILQEEETKEDKTTIMVGKLIAANVVSFTEVPNQVSKKSNGAWVKLTEMPDTIELSERQRLFVDFLNSKEGNVHLKDLQADVKKIDKK